MDSPKVKSFSPETAGLLKKISIPWRVLEEIREKGGEEERVVEDMEKGVMREEKHSNTDEHCRGMAKAVCPDSSARQLGHTWREGVNCPNHTWTHTDPSARETMWLPRGVYSKTGIRSKPEKKTT